MKKNQITLYGLRLKVRLMHPYKNKRQYFYYNTEVKPQYPEKMHLFCIWYTIA